MRIVNKIKDFRFKAFQIFDRDHESAIAWFKTIGEPTVLDSRFFAIADRWMQEDPVAAERWIRSTNLLSPSQKQAALAPRPPAPAP